MHQMVVRGLCVAALSLTMAVPAVQARADTSNPLVALVDAATQRLQTADPAAASKWVTNGPAIDDPPRVQQVLGAVSADATANNIDPSYVTRVFNDQINATEAIEYSRFAQWKLDSPSAPAAAPDLSASRTAIDALNHAMVSEIARNWGILHSPGCRSDLEEAKSDVVGARGLDALYQQALSFATGSYCQ
jgi:chorismate mutase